RRQRFRRCSVHLRHPSSQRRRPEKTFANRPKEKAAVGPAIEKKKGSSALQRAFHGQWRPSISAIMPAWAGGDCVEAGRIALHTWPSKNLAQNEVHPPAGIHH